MIHGCNIYMGAYDAKSGKPAGAGLQKDYRLTEAQKKELCDAMNAAAAEYRLFGEDYDYASISEKGRGFTVSDQILDLGEVIDMNARLSEEALEKNRELQSEHAGEVDEIFWGNTGSQWLIFSEHLYKNGFFDQMSAQDAHEVDRLLQSITAAMDDYSRFQQGGMVSYHAGIEGYSAIKTNRTQTVDYFNTSSEGMQFVLESCTEALNYFGETYIKDDSLREEFQKLTDLFHTHNARKIDGHRPMNEIMDIFRSRYAANIEAAIHFGPADPEGFRNSTELGGVAHTETEKKNYLSQLSLMFSRLKDGDGDFDRIWRKIEDRFTDYASGESRSQSIRSLALDRAGNSLQVMRDLWADLTGAGTQGSPLDKKA